MQIGKPLRTFAVEPLESPIPAPVSTPEHDEPEPVTPAHQPETAPQHEPVKQ